MGYSMILTLTAESNLQEDTFGDVDELVNFIIVPSSFEIDDASL